MRDRADLVIDIPNPTAAELKPPPICHFGFDAGVFAFSSRLFRIVAGYREMPVGSLARLFLDNPHGVREQQ